MCHSNKCDRKVFAIWISQHMVMACWHHYHQMYLFISPVFHNISTVSKMFKNGNIVLKNLPNYKWKWQWEGFCLLQPESGNHVTLPVAPHCNLTPCWCDSWDPQPGDKVKLSPQGEGDAKTSVLSVLHRMEKHWKWEFDWFRTGCRRRNVALGQR